MTWQRVGSGSTGMVNAKVRLLRSSRWSMGEGVTTQQLTFGTFEHGAPRFSPDGSRLALIRKSVSGSNVFVMSLEEREPRQLTFLTDDVWQPVWSADGLSIAFGTTVGDEARVWKVAARGGTPEPFGNSSLSRDLAWSPGADILYQRPGDSAFHFLDSEAGDETAFMDDSGGGVADPFQFFSWMASAPSSVIPGKEVNRSSWHSPRSSRDVTPNRVTHWRVRSTSRFSSTPRSRFRSRAR